MRRNSPRFQASNVVELAVVDGEVTRKKKKKKKNLHNSRFFFVVVVGLKLSCLPHKRHMYAQMSMIRRTIQTNVHAIRNRRPRRILGVAIKAHLVFRFGLQLFKSGRHKRFWQHLLQVARGRRSSSHLFTEIFNVAGVENETMFLGFLLMCAIHQCASYQPPTLTLILMHFESLAAPTVAADLAAFNATCAPAALQLMARAQFCIHAYWPFEAMRALAHALRADESCAMAHMLVATALSWNPGYDAARVEAIKRAMAHVDDAAAALTARERTLLRSLGAARRASKFDHLMLGALRTWPHDVEVQFMWIKRLTTRSIRSLGAPSELDRAQAQAMLDDMLRFQSLTPIQRALHAHYEIHAWDDTMTPERALRSAELLLGDAFEAPHLLHMSGHTFYSMGLFNRAVAVFERARSADLTYQRAANVEPINNWNFVHNWCYLVHALANSGRYADAVREASALGALRLEDAAAPEPLPFAVNASRCFGRWVFQGLLALPMVHWRFAHFDRCSSAIVAAMPRLREIEALHAWNEHVVLYFQFLQYYCDGMDHTFASRADDAAVALANATRALEHLDDAVSDTSALARLAGRGTEALRVCLAELSAAIAFSFGVDGNGNGFVHAIALERDLPYSEPPALPRSPRDSWIELLLRRRRGDDLARAEQLALELMDLPPKPVFAMAASAQIMEASGNANAAVAHWAAVRTAWSDADADIELVQRARAHSELRR
jgi:tetratricopeptide (TPR) repeat protein